MFNSNRCTSAFLALLAVVYLSACGSGANTKTTATQSAVVQPVETVATAPPTAAQKAAERIAVVRVGGKPITKATVDRLMAAQRPKIASYEPRSRADCSAVRVRGEVSSPKSVNGRPPTLAQLKQQCEQGHEQVLKKQVLDSLIASQWVLQEAAKDGLHVTDAEVKKVFSESTKKLYSSEADFQQSLKASGSTVSDVLANIRLELASEKIRQMIKSRVPKLSPAQIAAYYNQHKRQYAVAERRDIEGIRTWTRSASENAEREIRSGVSFADVAKRVSISSPSNERGGMIQGIVRGQEERGLDEAIFAAKPHVLVGPLHLRKRYWLFEVTRVLPTRQQPFAEIEASIAQQLPAERQQRALVDFIRNWRKRWTAKTDCSPAYVVPKCRQFKALPGTPREAEDAYALN